MDEFSNFISGFLLFILVTFIFGSAGVCLHLMFSDATIVGDPTFPCTEYRYPDVSKHEVFKPWCIKYEYKDNP